MRGYRTLDWRFWVALTACLMVTYLVVGGYQDNVAKGHRIDQLIQAAQDSQEQQAEADARASVERQALLANQRRLLRLYRAQVHRQEMVAHRLDGLLAYLQAHGITVPQEFRTGNPPGRHTSSGPKVGPQTGNPPASQSPGKAPGATPTAPPDPLAPITNLLHLLTKGTTS